MRIYFRHIVAELGESDVPTHALPYRTGVACRPLGTADPVSAGLDPAERASPS